MRPLIAALVVACLTGCTTTYKDFKVSKVKPDEGVAVGVVNILYNGKPYNKECAVCFNSVNGPCQNLTDEGIVFVNIKQGPAKLRRIVCKDTSQYHHNFETADFVQAPGITYIGQIDIVWTNSGGFKTTDMFGLIGAAIAESHNDGSVVMRVQKANPKELLLKYENQTGLLQQRFETNLVRMVP